MIHAAQPITRLTTLASAGDIADSRSSLVCCLRSAMPGWSSGSSLPRPYIHHIHKRTLASMPNLCQARQAIKLVAQAKTKFCWVWWPLAMRLGPELTCHPSNHIKEDEFTGFSHQEGAHLQSCLIQDNDRQEILVGKVALSHQLQVNMKKNIQTDSMTMKQMEILDLEFKFIQMEEGVVKRFHGDIESKHLVLSDALYNPKSPSIAESLP